MPKYLKQSRKVLHRTPTKDSRKKRMEEEQIVHPVSFDMSPKGEFKRFEETYCTLFGAKGIGKSTFGKELGDVLADRYKLKLPATYFLMSEPPNNSLSFRRSRIRTWPTFRSFVDKAEKSPEFVSTVKMWVIDTVDALVAQGISTIAYEWGILDLSDEGYARAWHELRDELVYQLIRLGEMGPGVLMLSHERGREMTISRMKIRVPSMDLSDSISNAVGYLCSMIVRMRYVSKSKSKNEIGHLRCLAVQGSEEEDVKDNLQVVTASYPDGIVRFKNEKEAAVKLLSCFDSNKPYKMIKKKKKIRRHKMK